MGHLPHGPSAAQAGPRRGIEDRLKPCEPEFCARPHQARTGPTSLGPNSRVGGRLWRTSAVAEPERGGRIDGIVPGLLLSFPPGDCPAPFAPADGAFFMAAASRAREPDCAEALLWNRF